MLVTLQQGGGGGALVEFIVSVIVRSLLLLSLPLFLLLVIVLLEIRFSQHRIGSKGLETVVEIDPVPLIGIVHPGLLIGIVSPHVILIPSSLSTLVLLSPLLLSEPHSIPSELLFGLQSVLLRRSKSRLFILQTTLVLAISHLVGGITTTIELSTP
jgi:hypothetical protein